MFGRSRERRVGPSGPHRFVAPRDPRAGLAISGVESALQQAPALAMTSASLQPYRCAMRGCGKARQDAIHEPEG